MNTTASYLATPQRLAARAPEGDIPPMDWQGGPVDCEACAYIDLRARDGGRGCEPGHACMQDAYARRIDRFFRTHPGLAREHLGHPYFEVRAIAARHTDPFHLPALIDDPDETVRMQVALRVPQRLLQTMTGDAHREVRIRVAQRIASEQLSRLLNDEDYEVRATVARRLPLALLPLLMHDSDVQVRCVVARRVEMPTLWRLVEDPAPEVRRIVAERLPAPLLAPLARDPEWLVRWEAAGRALGEVLQGLLDDDDAEVRLRASERLGELGELDELKSGSPSAIPRINPFRS